MERSLSVENEAYLSNELKTHGLLRAVHEKIRVIAITDINKIVRKDQSTGLPIVPVEPTVERLINMFRILRRCGLEVLSAKELAAILETCLRINSVFDMIKTFDVGVVTSLDTPGTVDQIASQTDSVAQSAYQILGLIIAKTFCLGEYFNAQVDGAGEHFARILSLAQEAQETVADIKRVARFESGNKFGDFFDCEAARQNKIAIAWLIGTAISAGSGIAYLVHSQHRLVIHISTMSAAKLFALELGQIAIASFIFFAMAFCAKTSASHRHNQLVNLHRAAALKTANIFGDATQADSLKDSILLQAAQAASAPQPTGFETTRTR